MLLFVLLLVFYCTWSCFNLCYGTLLSFMEQQEQLHCLSLTASFCMSSSCVACLSSYECHFNVISDITGKIKNKKTESVVNINNLINLYFCSNWSVIQSWRVDKEHRDKYDDTNVTPQRITCWGQPWKSFKMPKSPPQSRILLDHDRRY